MVPNITHKGIKADGRSRRNFPKDLPMPRVAKGNMEVLLQKNPDPYQHAEEGRKVILGPMPVKTFFEDFLPPVPVGSPVPTPLGAFKGVPSNPRSERDIYTSLAEDINYYRRCPSVTFRIAAGKRTYPRGRAHGPALFGYSISGVQRCSKEYGIVLAQRDDTTTFEGKLGLAEIFIAIRKTYDPFCDTHKLSKDSHQSFFSFENHRYVKESDYNAGKWEKRNLSEVVRHAADACSRQHRIFFFSILIIGTRARFFRWDRAGGIVTRSFDYKQCPELLCEFLWRFHHANPVQRGVDPSVVIASKAEEMLFVSLVKKHIAFQLGIDEADTEKMADALKQHYEKARVARMEVYVNGIQSAPRVFLVCVPLAVPTSATGRSTRAYWAVEVIAPGKGKVRFLKDAWRIDDDDVTDEGAIYKELEEGAVEFVCDLECSGDVQYSGVMGRCNEKERKGHRDDQAASRTAHENTSYIQCTRTNDYLDAPWVCECLRKSLHLHVSKHIHHRVVLKHAGYPLRTFQGSRELFGAAYDALRAIDSAYARCKRLHRDVSLDNIILYRCQASEPRRGLLIDWEFSALVDEHGKATDGAQMGTWPFMSRRALTAYDGFRHSKEDDMESLLYVVMYACVRWLPHEFTDFLGDWIYRFFDESYVGIRGQLAGGVRKEIEQSYAGSRFLEQFRFENHYVRMWFRAAYHYFETDHESARNKDAANLWTMDNFKYVFRNVCYGLSMTDGTKCDRVEHEVDGYLAALQEACHSTDTVLRGAARNFRVDTALLDSGSHPLDNEPIKHVDGVGSDESDDVKHRDNERRRVDGTGSQEAAAAVGEKAPRTDRKTSSAGSAHSDSALIAAPRRAYNLRSRRSGSQAVDQGKRRSPRLAARTNQRSSGQTPRSASRRI